MEMPKQKSNFYTFVTQVGLDSDNRWYLIKIPLFHFFIHFLFKIEVLLSNGFFKLYSYIYVKSVASEFPRSSRNFFSVFNKSLRVTLIQTVRDQIYLLLLETHQLGKIKFPKNPRGTAQLRFAIRYFNYKHSVNKFWVSFWNYEDRNIHDKNTTTVWNFFYCKIEISEISILICTNIMLRDKLRKLRNFKRKIKQHDFLYTLWM